MLAILLLCWHCLGLVNIVADLAGRLEMTWFAQGTSLKESSVTAWLYYGAIGCCLHPGSIIQKQTFQVEETMQGPVLEVIVPVLDLYCLVDYLRARDGAVAQVSSLLELSLVIAQ